MNMQLKPLKYMGQLHKVLPLRNATEVLGGGGGLSAASALFPSAGAASPGPHIGVFPLGQETCSAGGLSAQGIPAMPDREGAGLDPAGSSMTARFKGNIFLAGCKAIFQMAKAEQFKLNFLTSPSWPPCLHAQRRGRGLAGTRTTASLSSRGGPSRRGWSHGSNTLCCRPAVLWRLSKKH